MESNRQIGKAYGLFDCRASEVEIRSEIPTIRNLVNTPPEIDISLTGDVGSLVEDSYVSAFARKVGYKYAMTGKYPGGTNEQAADEVAVIINQAYQSPLFDEGEPFRGDIMYEKEGRYVFRD